MIAYLRSPRSMVRLNFPGMAHVGRCSLTSSSRRSRIGEHGNHQSVGRGADRHRRAVRAASSDRLRHGRAAGIHHAARRLRLRDGDRRDGGDELGRAKVWPGAPDRLDGRDHDGLVCGTIGLIVALQPNLWLGLFSDDAEWRAMVRFIFTLSGRLTCASASVSGCSS